MSRNMLEWIIDGLRTKTASVVIIRALFGCAGVLFLYAAFLGHHELYAVTWRAAGILFLAITGAILFHEAIR